MKVIKDYGAVAEYGSKALRLQTINDNRLALVSYKDGMSVNVTDITDEAKPLKRILENYLGYKKSVVKATAPKVATQKKATTPKKTEDNKTIKTLTTLPFNDGNFISALKGATDTEIKEAIDLMEKSGGRHSTRIKACNAELKRRSKGAKPTTQDAKVVDIVTKINEAMKKEQTKTAAAPKKEADIISFPTEDKRPQIIKLETNGNRTYGECEVKISKEMEIYKNDSDSMYVMEGLLELCKTDKDFRNNFMRKEKTYGGFIEYMFKAAQNGYCVRQGDVGWIDRDTGLQLAIDYYNADTEKMQAIEEKKREEANKKRQAELKKGAKKNGKKVNKKRKTTA